MEAVRREEFLSWAATVNIGFDERYPGSGCLTLKPPSDHARFWIVPSDPATWPHFIASLLSGLDSWTSGYLWPRSGSWPAAERTQTFKEGVRQVVLRGANIPDGWAGAVRLGREEYEAIVAVLFGSLAFGWCVDDDLFFVPDHGRQVLQTDHHDVIHVECATEERVLELVERMYQDGYELPTEPPDWTFVRPTWMSSASRS